MSLHERLTAGLAPDEARLPEHARFRDEGRSVRFDECNRAGTMRAAAVLRHAQDLAWQLIDFLGLNSMSLKASYASKAFRTSPW